MATRPRNKRWAFDYLPKVDRNYSWVQMWDDMYNGSLKGNACLRHERRGDRSHSKKNIDALKKADFWSSGDLSERDQRILAAPGPPPTK